MLHVYLRVSFSILCNWSQTAERIITERSVVTPGGEGSPMVEGSDHTIESESLIQRKMYIG